ncbi:MAG: cytochrome C [Planctomycetota bacterium]|nr:cytochrome C [Planctomycetota bacterium]
MPESLKAFLNWLTNPTILFTLVGVGMFLGIKYYRIVTKPKVALTIFLAFSLLFLLASFDPVLNKQVTKPDNVPIVGLFFLFGFFTWLAFRQMAINDERMEAGEVPVEKAEGSDKVMVWPDLVYVEFICMVLAAVILIVWSIVLQAPLEEPANPQKTPNPSKAPWYFLGLQEMLVYFDPWIAGVVVPGLIVVGLMAIPYVDVNPKGAGYYTLKERKFAVTFFMFGFGALWVTMVLSGTFLRGPGWNFFGPFEMWDSHKSVPLTNINLSEIIWVKALGTAPPQNWLVREIFGILLILGYFLITPGLLAKTYMKDFYKKMGPIRYSVMITLLLCMAGVVIKMYLRWIFNLKYIVAIKEFFFNI